MKKRNSLQIMFQLAGLIKGLTGYMLLAISMNHWSSLCNFYSCSRYHSPFNDFK